MGKEEGREVDRLHQAVSLNVKMLSSEWETVTYFHFLYLYYLPFYNETALFE